MRAVVQYHDDDEDPTLRAHNEWTLKCLYFGFHSFFKLNLGVGTEDIRALVAYLMVYTHVTHAMWNVNCMLVDADGNHHASSHTQNL